MKSTVATLLVSCPDRKGIVAALAQLLYEQGANILDADQHTDAAAGEFFQRIRFDMSEPRAGQKPLTSAIDRVAAQFAMRYTLSHADKPKRVAILVSKVDHCLHDLVLRQRAGELACEIPLVVSNHGALRPVVEGYGLPFLELPVSADTKAKREAELTDRLDAENIDLVVLARYMQIMSAKFCSHFAGRVINIHHSFLPAFVGGKPYHQAHARGVKLIGATAHYATSDLDEGPIIEQDVTRVSHRDKVPDLLRQGRDLERVVLARAVRAHLEDRVLIYGNKTVVF